MKLGTDAARGGDRAFASEVRRRAGEDPAECYQCGKCTAGCPMAFAMDMDPARVMRLVQLGQRDAVLGSRAIWLCASCETCMARCPQEVDLAAVMDALRIMAREAGLTSAQREVALFNQGFLDGVKSRGRVHETMLVMLHKLKTLHLLQDVGKGPTMMLKGKLPLRGHKPSDPGQVRRIFERVAEMEGGKE